MGVKPRRLQFVSNYTFPQSQPQPTPEEINRTHQEVLNQGDINQKNSDFALKNQINIQNDLDRRRRQEELHRQSVQQKDERYKDSIRQKNPQLSGVNSVDGNRGYNAGSQSNFLQQQIVNRRQQPSWGGNSLGNVVRQPNYPRVDYLEPVPYRRI